MLQPVALTISDGQGYLHVLASNIRVYTPVIDRAKGPDKSTQEIVAIWDTGASGSVISQRVVDQLELQPITMRLVNTANGQKISPAYLVDFHLIQMDMVIQGLNVTLGDLGQDLDALIGMDVINAGDFAITNRNGITKMSFRMPPKVHIDFVPEILKERALAARKQQKNRGPEPKRPKHR